MPKNIIGYDELSRQQRLQFFLSAFGVDLAKVRYGHGVLLRLVKCFVILIEEAIVCKAIIKKPRQIKAKAKEFVKNILKRELLPLSIEERKQRKYADCEVRLETILSTVWVKSFRRLVVGNLYLKSVLPFAKSIVGARFGEKRLSASKSHLQDIDKWTIFKDSHTQDYPCQGYIGVGESRN